MINTIFCPNGAIITQDINKTEIMGISLMTETIVDMTIATALTVITSSTETIIGADY